MNSLGQCQVDCGVDYASNYYWKSFRFLIWGIVSLTNYCVLQVHSDGV